MDGRTGRFPPWVLAETSELVPLITNTNAAGAMCELAWRFIAGTGGIERNEGHGIQWLARAAKGGYSPALHAMGDLYAEGKYVPQSDVCAVWYYRWAASRGHPAALTRLGDALRLGHLDLSVDLAQATVLYHRAAEQGFQWACVTLAYCYQNGQGVPVDLARGFEMYMRAARQLNCVAQHSVGLCYLSGSGVTQDFASAAAWMQKAADQGYPRALTHLGWLTKYGLGIPLDEAKAFTLYADAARRGDPEAQWRLAFMYLHGVGCARDEDAGVKWFRRAASAGDAEAAHYLDECYARRVGENDVSMTQARRTRVLFGGADADDSGKDSTDDSKSA